MPIFKPLFPSLVARGALLRRCLPLPASAPSARQLSFPPSEPFISRADGNTCSCRGRQENELTPRCFLPPLPPCWRSPSQRPEERSNFLGRPPRSELSSDGGPVHFIAKRRRSPPSKENATTNIPRWVSDVLGSPPRVRSILLLDGMCVCMCVCSNDSYWQSRDTTIHSSLPVFSSLKFSLFFSCFFP